MAVHLEQSEGRSDKNECSLQGDPEQNTVSFWNIFDSVDGILPNVSTAEDSLGTAHKQKSTLDFDVPNEQSFLEEQARVLY